MKFRHKFLLIAIAITILILSVACAGSKYESKLVGKWELTENVTILGFVMFSKGSEIEFYKNGNLDFMGAGYKYEIVEDKIKIFDNEETTYHEFELEGDNLTLYMEGTGIFSSKSIALEFVRVGK